LDVFDDCALFRAVHSLVAYLIAVKSVKYSLINSQNWIHITSDVSLRVNMTHLTVEYRLLIKTSQTEKGWIVDKNEC